MIVSMDVNKSGKKSDFIKIRKGMMKIMEYMVICIGRQYGSGGRLAQKLGINCYDKLLIKKAAEISGLNEEYIGREEEKPVNPLWYLSGNTFADIVGIGAAFYSDSAVIYSAEKAAIEQIAQKESCVIIGRSASEILRNKGSFSIFIYVDGHDRIDRVSARNGIDEKEASERICKIDKMRQRYFDAYSETGWGKAESYDMLLSSSRFGVESCTDLIMDALSMMKGGVSHE